MIVELLGRRARRALLVTTCATLTACGGAGPATPALEQAPAAANLQGAQPDSGYPAVGGVQDDWMESPECSGVLVAPGVVLSSSTCPKTWRDTLDFLAGSSTSDFVAYFATGMAVHPSKKLMILALEAPVTGVTPMAVNPGPVPAAGTSCVAVGLAAGAADPDTGLVAKVRRAFTRTVVSSDASLITVATGTGADEVLDRGGPLVCDGLVVGVAKSASTYVPVDAAWVAETVKRFEQ